MDKNIAVTISFQELQAIMQAVGQLPTQYGAGLYSFFVKKQQESVQNQVGVNVSADQTLTAEQEHG